jgi:hypothetical protein
LRKSEATELSVPTDDMEPRVGETELEMDELDIGRVEFQQGGGGEVGFQAGFEEVVFGEIMVAGAVGLGVMAGEDDGFGGESGDAGIQEGHEGSGVAGGRLVTSTVVSVQWRMAAAVSVVQERVVPEGSLVAPGHELGGEARDWTLPSPWYWTVPPV